MYVQYSLLHSPLRPQVPAAPLTVEAHEDRGGRVARAVTWANVAVRPLTESSDWWREGEQKKEVCEKGSVGILIVTNTRQGEISTRKGSRQRAPGWGRLT